MPAATTPWRSAALRRPRPRGPTARSRLPDRRRRRRATSTCTSSPAPTNPRVVGHATATRPQGNAVACRRSSGRANEAVVKAIAEVARRGRLDVALAGGRRRTQAPLRQGHRGEGRPDRLRRRPGRAAQDQGGVETGDPPKLVAVRSIRKVDQPMPKSTAPAAHRPQGSRQQAGGTAAWSRAAKAPRYAAATNGAVDHRAKAPAKDGIVATRTSTRRSWALAEDPAQAAGPSLIGPGRLSRTKPARLIEDGEMGDVQFDDSRAAATRWWSSSSLIFVLSGFPPARTSILTIDTPRIARQRRGHAWLLAGVRPPIRASGAGVHPWATELVGEKVKAGSAAGRPWTPFVHGRMADTSRRPAGGAARRRSPRWSSLSTSSAKHWAREHARHRAQRRRGRCGSTWPSTAALAFSRAARASDG